MKNQTRFKNPIVVMALVGILLLSAGWVNEQYWKVQTLEVGGTSTLTGAVTAPGGITGPTTGNVVGDVTGNLTGDSAGTHTGAVNATTITASSTVSTTGVLTALGGVVVGSGGTAYTKILLGNGTIANGDTFTSVTMSGVDSTWYPNVEIVNHTTNGVSKESSKPDTDRVEVVLTGDPGASGATIRIVAYKPQ
jgi:hypothetical protein